MNEVKGIQNVLDRRANQGRNEGAGTIQIYSVAYSQVYDLKCYK